MTLDAQNFASEDLDVMAEAYDRALDQLSGDFTEPEITQTLLEGLTTAMRDGVRDEDELAKAALAQIELDGGVSLHAKSRFR